MAYPAVVGPRLTYGGMTDAFVARITEVPLAAAIDIKPGSFPNAIEPRSHGRMPVAILSSADFDASATVDPASLTFGRTGDEPSLGFCNASAKDVNGDGKNEQARVDDDPPEGEAWCASAEARGRHAGGSSVR